jgi:DNA-binding CsgD family transcriptional regulator
VVWERAELMAVVAARGERDADALGVIAGDDRWTPLARAAATAILGRPGADDLDPRAAAALAAADWRPVDGPADRTLTCGQSLGEAGPGGYIPTRPGPGPHDAGKLLSPAPDRCLDDWRAGRWDAALDAALFATAADLAVGRPFLQSAVHRAAAEIMLARGRPARARAVLEAARADAAPLPHLMAPVAAEIEWLLGDPATAARLVGDALTEAARQGTLAGAEELWVVAAELAAVRGDELAAAVTWSRTTAQSALRAATARLITTRDDKAAAEAVELARGLDQPYELARTLERVVRWTGRRPELLTEAYGLLGDLGALLHRSRVRQSMREHGLAVPGRAQTLAEGEQLLAALVAEGLSNRELAAATQSSEKSVEGRLSRLFTRTGYRSRVELAAAVLVGEFRLS